VRGRNPHNQAILPIRGKILNVERARLDKMLKNNEIQALISAIGAGFGAEEFDITKIRYDRVILLCDADVDGSHIRTLLLTFFFRHMKDLVEQQHVYIAQPPLYSTVVGKEKLYLKDDAAKNAFLAENPNHKKEFARLKGLGEMDWDELKATTMDAASRTLLQVTVEQAANADAVVSTLMGDDVDARKTFIQTNAKDVRFLDI
jgi:DNA gyrase subunit B